MIEAGWYSFFNWDGYGPPQKFIGLKNYGYLVGNEVFARALINNGLVIVASLLVQLPLALGVAMMVAGRMPGAVWFRMIFFLPYILADVAAGLIWHFMFDGDYGLASTITGALGLQPYFLLASKDWAFSAILIVILWKYFGFHMMLYIAGTPGHRQDAARGCGNGRRHPVPALPPHYLAAARADDPPVDLLLGRRRAAALRHCRSPDRRRPVQHHPYDGVVSLLFRL